MGGNGKGGRTGSGLILARIAFRVLRLLAEKGLLAEQTAVALRRFDQAAVNQAAAE